LRCSNRKGGAEPTNDAEIYGNQKPPKGGIIQEEIDLKKYLKRVSI
jgi:hypothetical protein